MRRRHRGDSLPRGAEQAERFRREGAAGPRQGRGRALHQLAYRRRHAEGAEVDSQGAEGAQPQADEGGGGGGQKGSRSQAGGGLRRRPLGLGLGLGRRARGGGHPVRVERRALLARLGRLRHGGGGRAGGGPVGRRRGVRRLPRRGLRVHVTCTESVNQ